MLTLCGAHTFLSPQSHTTGKPIEGLGQLLRRLLEFSARPASYTALFPPPPGWQEPPAYPLLLLSAPPEKALAGAAAGSSARAAAPEKGVAGAGGGAGGAAAADARPKSARGAEGGREGFVLLGLLCMFGMSVGRCILALGERLHHIISWHCP